jgi:hypothetical protein
VVIAEFDATKNKVEVPGISIAAYPTIYYFPAENKSNPVKYKGERELNSFVTFLDQKLSL